MCSYQQILCNEISVKMSLEKELRNLKRQRATEIDSLRPGLLKYCAMYIATPLCYIINLSISTSTIPTIWKNAKVSQVFKSGDSSEPGNYRSISILPVHSKILEKAIYKQLMDHLKMEILLCNQQYGFHRKRSTKIAATLFCDRIREQMHSDKFIGAIYVYLTKAFDTTGQKELMISYQNLEFVVNHLISL